MTWRATESIIELFMLQFTNESAIFSFVFNAIVRDELMSQVLDLECTFLCLLSVETEQRKNQMTIISHNWHNRRYQHCCLIDATHWIEYLKGNSALNCNIHKLSMDMLVRQCLSLSCAKSKKIKKINVPI